MNHITSLLRGIIRTHVVLGITFTAAIIPLLAGNRPASETAAAPTVRNVVLVHGAFADGSSWAKVIPLLEAKGLHVTAVQNPLSSLADDVAATKRAIAMQEGPVILVGHAWPTRSRSRPGRRNHRGTSPSTTGCFLPNMSRQSQSLSTLRRQLSPQAMFQCCRRRRT